MALLLLFYTFLQISTYLHPICFPISRLDNVSLFPCHPSIPDNQPWDDLLTLRPLKKSLISKIYDMLMALDTHCIRSTTPCARLQLIQFKVLYRTHFSKSRLSEIYPNVLNQCDRCHACNLSHMFFFCPIIHKFWADFFTILTKALGRHVIRPGHLGL